MKKSKNLEFFPKVSLAHHEFDKLFISSTPEPWIMITQAYQIGWVKPADPSSLGVARHAWNQAQRHAPELSWAPFCSIFCIDHENDNENLWNKLWTELAPLGLESHPLGLQRPIGGAEYSFFEQKY